MHERAENGRMVLYFFTSYRDTLSRLLSLIPFSILFCTRHYDGSLTVFEKKRKNIGQSNDEKKAQLCCTRLVCFVRYPEEEIIVIINSTAVFLL